MIRIHTPILILVWFSVSKVLPHEVRFDLSTCLHHSNMFVVLGFSYINLLFYETTFTDITPKVFDFFLFQCHIMISYLTRCSVDYYYFSFREMEFELVHCESCIPVGHTLFKFFLCGCSFRDVIRIC